MRTSYKKYVEVKNAELKLLSESRKVSNLIFSLDFHQRQAVGEKIQPCTYSIYMTDDEGIAVSDRQTVIADKTSDNAADRVFRVRFNLKAKTYDKNKVYRLVIANDTDVPDEIEIFQGGQAEKDIRLIGDEAELLLCFQRLFLDIQAVDQNLSFVRIQHAGNHAGNGLCWNRHCRGPGLRR